MSEQSNAHTPLFVDTLQQSVSKEAAPLLNFVLKHIKMIAAGLLALVMLISGVGMYHYMHDQKILTAQTELATLAAGASTEAQLADLKAFVETVSAEVRPAALLTLAKASLRVNDYAAAESAWAALQATGIDSMREIAGMGRANAYAKMGKLTEAVTVLETLVPQASKAYVLTVKHQLALMAEQSGDVEKALAVYKELETAVPAANKKFYTHKIASLSNQKK